MKKGTLRAPAILQGLVCVLSLAISGCASAPSSYMPLARGNQWKYLLRETGRSILLREAGRVRVGSHQGWKISGEAGESRLLWHNDTLLAGRLTATTFDPPIILLQPTKKQTFWDYKGKARARMTTGECTGKLIQRPERIKVGGVERDTLRVDANLNVAGEKIELTTWFQKNVGIVQQEQRNDGRLVVSMILLQKL